MSDIDGRPFGLQATESEALGIAGEANRVPLISALPRAALLRIAFVMVGIVGVVLAVAAFAGWVPGVNQDVRQAGTGRQKGLVADSAKEASSVSDDTVTASVVETPRPTPTPIVHVVADGETLLGIAANYGTTADLIARANDLWDPNRLKVGQTLTIPMMPMPEYSSTADKTDPLGVMRMWWPVQGEITTEFGEKESYYIGGAHTGIDIAANTGIPVRAAAAGKVVVAWKRTDNVGWHIVLDHGDGWSTLYGHMSKFFVDEGDSVERGQVIGAVGETGFAFGPHLHFEVRHWGVPEDPMKHLP